jgi:hypothetical protein
VHGEIPTGPSPIRGAIAPPMAAADAEPGIMEDDRSMLDEVDIHGPEPVHAPSKSSLDEFTCNPCFSSLQTMIMCMSDLDACGRVAVRCLVSRG